MSTLSWWFAPHPDWEPAEDWDENVPVVRYETDEAVVVIDPFLPPDDSFDPHGKPVQVLLTQGAHYRGTSDFVARYGASIWAPPHAAWRKRPNPATTTELPDGIEAIELDGESQQVVFFIRDHATLVTGDVLSGTGGRLHVFVDDADADRLLPALDALCDLPIEQVIIPHGDAIRSDGAARIRAAVARGRPMIGFVGLRLETARLVIRTFDHGDADAWIAMLNDPEVRRFLPSGPVATTETFERALESRHAMEREIGYAMWAVEERTTGTFIGQCGLRPAKSMDETAGSEIDLGYHFARTSWNRGVATEAAVAVLAYGLGPLGLDSIMAVAAPENIGSWRVMEKAGMRYEGQAAYYGSKDLKKYVAQQEWWSLPLFP